MPANDYPSAERIRQLFTYEDGKLIWKKRSREDFKRERSWKMWNTRYAGTVAGCVANYEDKTGEVRQRVKIAIDGVPYLRSQLVWTFHYGSWPDGMDVDHDDTDTLNDLIENLVACTHVENLRKKRKPSHNKSGYKGVHWFKPTGKWRAQIKIGDKQVCLGYFDDPAKAHLVYMETAREHYGKFARDGNYGS